MIDDFSDLIDEEDTYDVITMIDENNEEKDCFVIDAIKVDEIQYLLVVDSNSYDDDEAEAFIIKEISENGEDVFYEFVIDDEEYNKVVILLQDEDTEYEMKF